MNPTRRIYLLIGLSIASIVPLSSIAVAFLWDHGAISPDPDGWIVAGIEAALPPALVLIPIGVGVIGVALRLRQPVAWVALFLVGVPILAAAWFIGAASLGSLSGEPF